MVLIFISIFLWMVRYLFMWYKGYVVHWWNYGLEQGNPLQNFQITKQIIMILFSFLWFYFLYQYVYQWLYLYLRNGKYMSAIEATTVWNTGIHWKNYISLIKLYFSCFFFIVLLFISIFNQWCGIYLCEIKDMLSIDVTIAWNRGIPCKYFKSLIKL